MMNWRKALLVPVILSATLCTFSAPLEAKYVVKGGGLVDERDVAQKSVQEHYSLGMQAMQDKDWRTVVRQFRKVVGSFPNTSFARDGLYYLGVGYFHKGDFDLANQRLSAYLLANTSSKHYEDALRYKLAIAEKFRGGAGRHLFGMESLPRWLPAKAKAVDIYDEVVAALPSHDLAAQALYAKAQLLSQLRRYPESIESYQTLIHRFPKHELVATSYGAVAEVLCVQGDYQENNPDLLPLAEINLRKFRDHLPRDERVKDLEEKMARVREANAVGLYETGQFYERVKQPRASVIYYVSALRRFPEAQIAEQCRQRIRSLGDYVEDLALPEEAL